MVWQWIWAGAIVGLLTWLEVWKRFGVVKRLDFWLWSLGFAGVNSFLALLLYELLLETGSLDGLSNISPSFRSILVAMGYLTLVRTKIITLRIKDQEVPLGIEAFYESLKEFVYNQINEITSQEKENAIQGLTEKSISEYGSKSSALAYLGGRANLRILADSLLIHQDKEELKIWITSVLEDNKSTHEERLRTMANFILFKIK